MPTRESKTALGLGDGVTRVSDVAFGVSVYLACQEQELAESRDFKAPVEDVAAVGGVWLGECFLGGHFWSPFATDYGLWGMGVTFTLTRQRRGDGRDCQVRIMMPPSTKKGSPVVKEQESEAR